MIVAVQLCFRTPPPVVVCREDLPEEWARPKKVSTNQLIIEGEENLLASNSRATEEEHV